MLKRIISTAVLLGILIFGFSLSVFAQNEDATQDNLKDVSFEDLSGMEAGVLDGTIQDTVIEGLVENPQFEYFKSFADECIALEQGKVDYVLVVEEQYSFVADQYDDLVMIPQIKTSCGELGFVFAKDSAGDTIREKFDEYIIRIRENGELEKLQNYWFNAGKKEVVDLPSEGTAGVLTVASGATSPPFVYLEDNKFNGFEVALLAGFGREYGYGIDIEITDFTGILPAVSSGKCNLAANCLIKTAERQEEVNFSETTCEPMFTILMRSDKAASFAGVKVNSSSGKKTSFFDGIGKSFYKTFIKESRWKLLLQGCVVTILLTLLSGLMGIFLGLQVYKVRVCNKRICRKLIGIFNAVMGGTPMVVLLLIFYYIIFNAIDLSAFFVAVIAFGLNESSSISEIYYSTINGIDRGQMEAALALGYSEKYAFHRFILPQALKRALPLITGQMIALLKGTAIVGFISLQDLTKMGDLIRSRTYDAFFPLITVAVIYFIFAWVIRLVMGYIAKVTDPVIRRDQRIKKKGELR